ncbi:MAG: V-type ATP synthase subunit E, partial [Thermoplasmatales archaeon]|nr:V-type ATP synthase subunit E [Thermoplasmatales archaeon]
MTAEKIIERIKKDSEKEIQAILEEAERQASGIIKDAKKEAEHGYEKMIADGNRHSENLKKILVSKASQDAKREIMKAREKIIEECFAKAQRRLSTLKEAEYKKIVMKLIEAGRKKLDGQCTIVVSGDIDRKIAKGMGLKVTGTVEALGGVILKSSDGGITLDNTFEGILKRKKDEIRIKV